jgi:hypothetical protein
MMKTHSRLIMAMLLLMGFVPGAAWAEPAAEAPEASPSLLTREHIESRRAELGFLREMGEGALFTLQRYATLEALITAVDRGQQENQAFLIGASSIIPGVGQFINADYLQGGLLLFSDSIAGTTANQLAYTRHTKSEMTSPAYYSVVALKNGIMLYATLHAANSSYRARHDRTRAMWTGMASIVPGVGQAINGDWWEAGGLAVTWLVTAMLAAEFENSSRMENKNLTVNKDSESTWSIALLPDCTGVMVTKQW